MPRAAAARAAPTVPEMATNGPTFWPRLIPDTVSVGRRCRSSSATRTVSAGNPFTAVAGKPLAVVAAVRARAPGVVLPPLPLWLAAGATTTTDTPGTVRNLLTSTSRPGADTPSSLVTRIWTAGVAGAPLGGELPPLGLPPVEPPPGLLPEPLQAASSAAAAVRATSDAERRAGDRCAWRRDGTGAGGGGSQDDRGSETADSDASAGNGRSGRAAGAGAGTPGSGTSAAWASSFAWVSPAASEGLNSGSSDASALPVAISSSARRRKHRCQPHRATAIMAIGIQARCK